MLRLLLLLLLALRGQPGTGAATHGEDYVTKLREQFEYFKQLILHDLATKSDVVDFADYDLRVASLECEKPAEITCNDLERIPDASCGCGDTGNLCDIEHKGDCKLAWQRSTHCDFFLNNSCHGNCTCCISCSKNVDTPCREAGGVCEKSCGQFQYRSDHACHSSWCSCCHSVEDKGCRESNSLSRCVGDPSYCGRGYYENNILCESPGTCCIPCTALDSCINANGYCESDGYDCLPGFYKDDGGCKTGNCRCCKPKTDTVCARDGTAVMGPADICSPRFCPRNFFQQNVGCSSPNRTCYSCEAGGWHKCDMGDSCIAKGGYCSKSGCGDTEMFLEEEGGCTSRDDRPCFCCFPKCKFYSEEHHF
ncbi:extracellular matrix organizing protein FRAS1-like [Penaeus chinensis]|uniref:extracellular matrix organizing protein FRAS1-like n=1 Tax=Penaeus chinensis TaxID=139456 RepID=UPI001FB7D52E|nr:extracellular matrix organizing protein FRAS1-like [Penaeus chinensis]XP_047498083.1 extracellular matrix organizing protein FRAS1-like [Penaeus chinensis]XP_047498084.1 extracellular matrix organizing protein FRAS1-like [Penaeus chinensis]XP_047498085.1 extracellular matrix organizing protein FRAS1-like [Penaeus chinensis]